MSSLMDLDMQSEVEVCALEELPVGLGRAFDIGGKVIGIFRTRGGEIRAMDNRCPHKGAPLTDGMIAGSCVVCPYHAFKYDLESGACDQASAPGVATYAVRVEGGKVFVRMG